MPNIFDLGFLLIKPVQRILKYPLLLGKLAVTSDSKDAAGFDDYKTAHAMMEAVANDINEDKRRKDLGNILAKISFFLKEGGNFDFRVF